MGPPLPPLSKTGVFMPSSAAEISKASSAPFKVLLISTASFTLLFAVWLMLGLLGIAIRQEFNLSSHQMEWLLATALLAGSLPRLHFGILTDRLGGRLVMTLLLVWASVPCFWLSRADQVWEFFACAFLAGIAGNSFTVGVSWNSVWSPSNRLGTALGVFGSGNVGASLTKFLAPLAMTFLPAAGFLGGWIPGGWRVIPLVYCVLCLFMAGWVWLGSPSPDRCPGRGRTTREMLAPLGNSRVWRLGFYYVVVFGAFVALASWLPSYYVDHFGLSLASAGALTAGFIFPASLLRPFGGWLSDLFGARLITYSVFLVMVAALFLLCLPSTILALNVQSFTALILVVGVGMGIGMASVFKYVPAYFPKDVGAVGGLVGLLGALGGFALPPLFGLVSRTTGQPQSAFLVLLGLTLVSLGWLHLTVLGIRRQECRQTSDLATLTGT